MISLVATGEESSGSDDMDLAPASTMQVPDDMDLAPTSTMQVLDDMDLVPASTMQVLEALQGMESRIMSKLAELQSVTKVTKITNYVYEDDSVASESDNMKAVLKIQHAYRSYHEKKKTVCLKYVVQSETTGEDISGEFICKWGQRTMVKDIMYKFHNFMGYDSSVRFCFKMIVKGKVVDSFRRMQEYVYSGLVFTVHWTNMLSGGGSFDISGVFLFSVIVACIICLVLLLLVLFVLATVRQEGTA
jgi:hypothetical protein